MSATIISLISGRRTIPDTYIQLVPMRLSSLLLPFIAVRIRLRLLSTRLELIAFLPIIICSHFVFEYYVLVRFARATPTMCTAFAWSWRSDRATDRMEWKGNLAIAEKQSVYVYAMHPVGFGGSEDPHRPAEGQYSRYQSS